MGILPQTPQDKESKRRRLTSDSVGGVIHLRSNGEIYTAADIALGATLGCTNPEEIVMEKLNYWSAELTRLQPKVGQHRSFQRVCNVEKERINLFFF